MKTQREITYEIMVMHSDEKLTEPCAAVHTNPVVVMTFLNEIQHLHRMVKVSINGKVAGYQVYRPDRRVTALDIANPKKETPE